MAQFGNPPWVRDASALSQGGVPIASLSQQPGMAPTILSQPGLATPTIYNLGGATLPPPQQQFNPGQPLGLAAIQQAALQQSVQLSQPGIAIPTTLATSHVATVSYPTPRASNMGGAAGSNQQQQQQQQQKRVFTGIVTKLHDNFGFVDEDVFFQMACVKGQIPKVGDRVLVEASYNATMPFKWNATRIQMLPNQGTAMSSTQFGQQAALSSSGYAMKPPTQLITPATLGGVTPPPLMGGAQKSKPGVMLGGRNTMLGSSSRNDRARDRPRDRDRSGSRATSNRRPSPPSSTSSSSKRARSRSPIARRSRRSAQPRYSVQIPKISLDSREANVMTLKSRYANMYIPSDFFDATFGWVSAFPLHRPLVFCNAVNFSVMNKEVRPPLLPSHVSKPTEGALDAEVTDADHIYSAKVLLLSSPPWDEFFQQCLDLSAESDGESSTTLQHPTRLIQFLVGLNGKSEPMAIGGPWSASADGEDPAGDPSVLIRTAIRTTRALTGIDLSRCTQWYRFAEVRYRRRGADETHKGRAARATRVETVVLFLPDTASCLPARLEWLATRDAYLRQLTQTPGDAAATAPAAAHQEDDEEEMANAEEEDGTAAAVAKIEPTHHSELDPRNMKVSELRQELECRSLGVKGLKSQLIARLLKAIKAEQDKDQEEASDARDDVKDEPVKSEPEDKDEAERKQREQEDDHRSGEQARKERLLTLPSDPAIIVHPSATAKHGRFDCTVMSLSVLLDYRPEDNKEHSFEVSLFAELFNEMLMRDCAFNIYRALVVAPERVKTDDDKHKHGKDDKNESSTKKRKHSDEDDKKRNDKKEDRNSEKRNDKDRRSDDGEDDDDNDADEDKEKGTRKRDDHKVTDPNLLMSFVYFDLNRTGYIADSDLEEILHTIGLRLSRAQIKKLVQKVVTRENLHYRKLTNRPLEGADAGGDDAEMADGLQEDEENKCKKAAIDDKTLAEGNRILLRRLCEAPCTPANCASDSGMVQYEGALVDVASVLQQLERSEKMRVAVELKLKDIQQQLDSGRDALASSESDSQQIAAKLAETQKLLAEARHTAAERERQYTTYEKAVNRTRTSLTSLLDDLQEVASSTRVKDTIDGVVASSNEST